MGWGNVGIVCGKLRRRPEGRALLRQADPADHLVYLLMDRACESDETRALAMELGYIPVVPPKSSRKNPWEYDKRLYKQRNRVEKFPRRIKRFRRIFTRYDKLDSVFWGFHLLRSYCRCTYVNRP